MPDPTPNPSNQQRPRSMLLVIMLLCGAMLMAWALIHNTGNDKPWSLFLDLVRDGKVLNITIGSEMLTAEPQNSDPTERTDRYNVYFPGGRLNEGNQADLRAAINDWNQTVDRRIAAAAKEGRSSPLIAKVTEKGVQPEGVMAQTLPILLVTLVMFGLLWFLFFRRMGQGGGVLSFGKSRAQLIQKGKTGKTFKDVAGIDEAKEEVEELVAFLKNPKKFQKLGGRIPRGVLLVGSPGTGKTLLAKAIAGEADVPFYSISGSDFVEMFVGVGASRVRDLFSQAKDNAPCIIFIDEIDAVGRRRGQGFSSGGHDEREQTLNAILVEMDGFGSGDKVIVIAATNRMDVLDPALLRPGRFDRHIHVNLPDIAGREQILKVHGGKVKLLPEADLSKVARGTPGFSGADLESMINEAALNAARHDAEGIGQKDLDYARDRVAFGREKKTGSRAMPEKERKVTAYHEAGHALLQLLVDEGDDLHKVTIIPRGRALGMSMSLPNEDRHTHSRKRLLSDVCILFGGRIAEEMFCGDITTGASNDIQRASTIARGMVYEWGMSERMGPLKYTEDQEGMAGTEHHVMASGATRRELDEEVRSIIDGQYQRAKDLISLHRVALEKVAQALLEYETLDGSQVKHLLNGGDIPPRAPTINRDEGSSGTPAATPEPGLILEPKLA